MTPPQLRWTGTGLSHPGQVRTVNQDAFAIDNERGFWVVADGMGGYTGGQVASELAVTTLVAHVQATPQTRLPDTDQLAHVTAILDQAVTDTKKAIQDRIGKEPDLLNMGTTVVSAWFFPAPTPSIAVAHMGDSRAYRIRGRRLESITTDHSFVQQLVAEGHITLEQARDHPKRNVITRALGLNFPSTLDVTMHPLDPGDMLLLCTDGLTKMLPDDDILAVILESWETPKVACQRLIDRANEAGGSDNTTALLITPYSA